MLEHKLRDISADNGICISAEILYRRYNSDKYADKVHSMVDQFKDARKIFLASNKNFYDICLYDFGADSSKIKSLLEERGFSVALQSECSAELAAASKLQVFSDSENFKIDAFRILNIPFISPIQPYGFDATEKFLQSIIEALKSCESKYSDSPKKNNNSDNLSILPSSEEIEVFSSLLEKLRNCLFGFIISEHDDVNLFEKGNKLPAAYAISFIRSCGLEFVFFIKNKGKAKVDMLSIEQLFPDSKKVLYNNLEELKSLIAEEQNLKFIYSDIRDDFRIFSLGKIPFSRNILEPGYLGAIETLRRFSELRELSL